MRIVAFGSLFVSMQIGFSCPRGGRLVVYCSCMTTSCINFRLHRILAITILSSFVKFSSHKHHSDNNLDGNQTNRACHGALLISPISHQLVLRTGAFENKNDENILLAHAAAVTFITNRHIAQEEERVATGGKKKEAHASCIIRRAAGSFRFSAAGMDRETTRRCSGLEGLFPCVCAVRVWYLLSPLPASLVGFLRRCGLVRFVLIRGVKVKWLLFFFFFRLVGGLGGEGHVIALVFFYRFHGCMLVISVCLSGSVS